VLGIGLPDYTSHQQLDEIAKQMKAVYPTLKTIIYLGDWKLHVVKAEEAQLVKDFNTELKELMSEVEATATALSAAVSSGWTLIGRASREDASAQTLRTSLKRCSAWRYPITTRLGPHL
jgi:hypothetical protein